jgi:hypothetical protein
MTLISTQNDPADLNTQASSAEKDMGFAAHASNRLAAGTRD